MKDRIAHIIRAKNLTAAEFALRLGIQPSNVSHILAGRNNPSLEFVRKLKETFPEYNLDWIVFGKGPMTVSEPFVEPRGAEITPVATDSDVEDDPMNLEHTLFSPENESEPMSKPISVPLPTLPQGDLKHIILVYVDNTFEVLSPR